MGVVSDGGGLWWGGGVVSDGGGLWWGWSYKAGATVYNYRSSGVISEVVSDGGGHIKQGPLYITIGQAVL